jgi:hypothetical protein
MNVSQILAAVIALPAADRAAIARALRADSAGLHLVPSSVAATSEAEVRAMCGRTVPAETEADPLAFTVTARHVQILQEAAARVAAMVGTRSSTVQLSGS